MGRSTFFTLTPLASVPLGFVVLLWPLYPRVSPPRFLPEVLLAPPYAEGRLKAPLLVVEFLSRSVTHRNFRRRGPPASAGRGIRPFSSHLVKAQSELMTAEAISSSPCARPRGSPCPTLAARYG